VGRILRECKLGDNFAADDRLSAAPGCVGRKGVLFKDGVFARRAEIQVDLLASGTMLVSAEKSLTCLRKIMKTALSLLIGLLLTGCVTYQLPLLPLGASTAQVQSIVGPPKSKSRDGSVTTWNYGEGMVCVFRNGQLIATNFNAPSEQGFQSYGSFLPPVAINVTPAPYYSAPVYAVPYYSGWGTPFYGGGGGNYWGGGWNRSYWGGNWNQGVYNRGCWNGNRGNWNRRY